MVLENIKNIQSPVLKKFIETYRYIFQYPDSLQFNKSGWVDTVNDGTWYTLTSFQVPKGHKGVLKTFYIDSRFSDDFGDLSYRILKNGNPILDYERVDKFFTYLFYYTLGGVFRGMGGNITIPLEENDLIQLQLLVAVAYGGSARTAHGIKGWYWAI